jgi:hypothetical protein
MGTLIVVAVVLVFAVVGTLLGGKDDAPISRLPAVTLADVPRIFAAVSAAGGDGAFAAFLFGPDGQAPAPQDALNVQFSTEAGRVGIDWVPFAPLNVESQPRFIDFFKRKDVPLLERERKGVRYFRVEGERLAELMQEFLASEFKVRPDQKMYLLTDGFLRSGV